MIKPSDPRQLAVDLIPRSTCHVQVAAVIADKYSIMSWGWNSPGAGYGECAELAAIRRANKKRLFGSTIYVAGQRRRNSKPVPSKPCENCQKYIDKWELQVVYRNSNGMWVME